MLSIFPSLLIFGIFAPFILRVTVGIYLFHIGYQHLGKEQGSIVQDIAQKVGAYAKPIAIFTALVEVVIGLSLIAGFLTQIAAIIGIIYAIKMMWFKKECPALVRHERVFYMLLLVILLSLLITGPGVFAIDLPL